MTLAVRTPLISCGQMDVTRQMTLALV